MHLSVRSAVKEDSLFFTLFVAMQHLATALFALALTTGVHAQVPSAECHAGDSRIPILFVGSYHMSNPGLDAFNLDADDVLTETRQSEILEVVNQLAQFSPTKVAVEAPWADSTARARYDAFTQGNLDLTRSEEEQIGFRLAHQLDHTTIYPIDNRMMLDQSQVGAALEANPSLGAYMGKIQHIGETALDSMGTWLSTGTIQNMLNKMNQPEFLRLAHEPYHLLLGIVDADTYAGPDVVSTWYQRNLRIFANLTRIAEPDDRLFVLYGQGHIPILRQLASESHAFCLEDPLPYLSDQM
ncbi:MAG: hypothetical protein Rubg2KO_13900 [Rubricoccaceae bacterium]